MPKDSEPIQIVHADTGKKRTVPRGQLRTLGKHGWSEVTEPGTVDAGRLDDAGTETVEVTEPANPWLTEPSEED